jgi:transcriptional regulator with XRE-family HTH domain
MTVDIEKWKQAKKEKHLSYDDLAKITGYSRSTITNIFCGYIDLPRHETIQAIERALGLEEQKTPPVQELTEDEQEIFTIISQLTDEEIQEARAILQYILNKRA